MRSILQWPTPFPIPYFSYDVELKLCKGNDVYKKTGVGLSVTRDMKMEILEKLAQEIFALKAYPVKYEIECVASELVSKHPPLKEPGSCSGYDGRTTSIKYKLGNYQSKLRQAGCERRGEVNYAPEHPENFDEKSVEDQICVLVDAMKKKKKDMKLIREKIDLTFSLRRKEIIEVEPMVLEIQERWTALFLEEQARPFHTYQCWLHCLTSFMWTTINLLFAC